MWVCVSGPCVLTLSGRNMRSSSIRSKSTAIVVRGEEKNEIELIYAYVDEQPQTNRSYKASCIAHMNGYTRYRNDFLRVVKKQQIKWNWYQRLGSFHNACPIGRAFGDTFVLSSASQRHLAWILRHCMKIYCMLTQIKEELTYNFSRRRSIISLSLHCYQVLR